ncbi:unnamed protein product [Effrenium voratum]|nr:unnamed protein product [Effrenium voratum]
MAAWRYRPRRKRAAEAIFSGVLRAFGAGSKREDPGKLGSAAQELGQLQAQLQEAQQKLNPLKNVRQEFVQRTAAQKIMQEVLEKLSPAEVDVDRAEEATEMLKHEGLSKESELMVQAQQAVAKAGDHIGAVMRFIETKKKTAVGLAKEELSKMEERARQQSVQRLADLKSSQKEASERVGLEVLVKEASEKLATVAETVSKAADAEGPFLMGVEENGLLGNRAKPKTKEELPLDETLAAVKVGVLELYLGRACSTASRKPSAMAWRWMWRLLLCLVLAPFVLFMVMEKEEPDLEASPTQRARMRAGCSLAFLVFYYFWTVRHYEPLKHVPPDHRSADILEDSPVCICRHVSLPNCMLSFYCEYARNAHTLEKTGMAAYWQGALASLCCLPCTLLYFQNGVRKAMGAGRVDPLAGCVYAFCCPWCLVAQQAEALDTATGQHLQAFLQVGRGARPRFGFGTEEEQEARYAARDQPGASSPRGVPSASCVGEALAGRTERRRMAVETASTAANTAASIARMFIATPAIRSARMCQHTQESRVIMESCSTARKLVEAKRFTPELGKEAQTKLKAFQSDLETHTKRLNELKKSTAERKKAVTVREAEHEVKKAEDLAKEVAKAAEPLEDEKLAQLSSELIKYEARLRAVATEIGGLALGMGGKYKKISASVESRLAAKKAIEDCSAKVKAVEQKFERLTELSEAIDGEKASRARRLRADRAPIARRARRDKEEGKEPDISKDSKEKVQKALKEAEAAAAEMQAMRFTDMQIKIQPAASKEVEKLKPRLEELQQSLDKTVSGMRPSTPERETHTGGERSEKAIVDSIVKDSEHRVKEVEEAMKKLEEAEKPFKAEQEIPAEQVSESLSALEGAAQAATQALSGAKTFVGAARQGARRGAEKLVAGGWRAVKKLAARRLAEAPKKAAEEQLNVVVTRLDELKAMNEQKQAPVLHSLGLAKDLVKKEVEGKVIEAEKKVQLAEEATAELAKLIQSEAEEEKPEGAAELPADQVKSNCEKAKWAAVSRVGSAQQEARTSVTSAQKLLLSRQRDAKNGSGPPNLLEDINKQLENLTKMLTSLDKQKSTLRDQEHKYVAQKLQKDVMTLAATEEAKLAKLYPVAEELVASLGGDQANPLAAMESCQKDLTTAQESLADTMSKIKEKMEGIKGQTLPKGGYLAEARNGLVKLKVKGLTADALFKQLSNGEPEVKQANLRAFVEKIPDSPVKASQLDLALDKFASGMSKLNVLEMVQEFKRCVKEVALTNTLEVKDGKTVRKLGLGEVLEVLETGRKDEVTGLSRLRCRALVDLKEGWVTVEGNAGSSFLEPCRKPYFCCEHESVLQQTFESNSATLKTLQVGEVLELAEGPRKENPPGVMRVKAKTLKDGKVGFLTCKDVAKEYWRPAKVMVCKQSIALTTGFDIAAGKAVRKLEVGEALDILEGPSEDAVRSLSRAKVLAKKDGQEGWLTIKGNQGTSYAEESERHYICSESIVLEAKFATGSTEVRRVEEGELLEALEEPKPETKEGVQRCRGRTLADGTEGWFTLTKSFVPWSPAYKCVSSTVLNNGLEIKEAKTLRKLARLSEPTRAD